MNCKHKMELNIAPLWAEALQTALLSRNTSVKYYVSIAPNVRSGRIP